MNDEERLERRRAAGREYQRRAQAKLSAEEKRRRAQAMYQKRTPEQRAKYHLRERERTRARRAEAAPSLGGDPMVDGFMVLARNGKVHVLRVAHPGYRLRLLGPTYCGRDLASYSYPVDLDAVTTTQVCRLCIRHLPGEEL